jgi:hypothetical protein
MQPFQLLSLLATASLVAALPEVINVKNAAANLSAANVEFEVGGANFLDAGARDRLKTRCLDHMPEGAWFSNSWCEVC